MEPKDAKVIEKMSTGDDNPQAAAADGDFLRQFIVDKAAPVAEDEPESEQLPAKETPKPIKVDPAKETPAKETSAEPESETESKPATEVPKEPTDLETEVTRRAQEMFEQQRQKLVDEIVRKERNREENALKRIRDFEVLTGQKLEDAAANRRVQRVTELQETYSMSEDEARAQVDKEERLARYEAEKAETAQRHEEEQAVNAYASARLAYLSDATVSAHTKALVQKYAKEIEDFAGNGRVLPFEVAVNQILGQKHDEILANVRSAAKQEAIREIEQRGKAKPSMASVASPGSDSSLTPDQRTFFKKLGLPDEDISAIALKRAKRK